MDHDPKQIGALSRALIESSSGSVSSANPSTDPVVAVERAKLMFGCYRKDDAADPETYSAAVAAVLAEYGPDIVQRVTDPRSGLPSKQNWLPTVKEVRDACEEIDGRRRRMAESAEREREQLSARKAFGAKPRPTLEELKEKHGPRWGLIAEEENKKLKARQTAFLERANKQAFEAECKEAGMPADSQISPTLRALIEAKRV